MSTYQIKSGDTLGSLASMFGTTTGDLASRNNIADPNMIYAGQTLNYGDNTPQAQPQADSSLNPAPRKAFSDVLPIDKAFSPNLITGLAESQVNPEVARQQDMGMRTLNSQLAQSGGFRSGVGDFQRNNMANSYERSRKEQVQNFIDSIQGNVNNWYNQQYTNYNQNPSAYVTPSTTGFNNYMQANPTLANAFNTQTNTPTTYNNPFFF